MRWFIRPGFADPATKFEVKYRMQTQTGDYRWFISNGQTVCDENGVAERMVGFTCDITDRKRIVRAVTRSETQLREAQRIANLGSWRLNLETDEVTWSKQLFAMFGLPPAETAPSYKDQESMFTEDSWELLSLHVEKAIKEGESYALELETLLPDGATRWVLARGERVVDSEGGATALQGTAQDITKIKTVQDTLREQAVLIDQSPDAFIVWDLDQIGQFWSQGAERIFGITSDDALDQEVTDILEFDAEMFAEADREIREKGGMAR